MQTAHPCLCLLQPVHTPAVYTPAWQSHTSHDTKRGDHIQPMFCNRTRHNCCAEQASSQNKSARQLLTTRMNEPRSLGRSRAAFQRTLDVAAAQPPRAGAPSAASHGPSRARSHRRRPARQGARPGAAARRAKSPAADPGAAAAASRCANAARHRSSSRGAMGAAKSTPRSAAGASAPAASSSAVSRARLASRRTSSLAAYGARERIRDA